MQNDTITNSTDQKNGMDILTLTTEINRYLPSFNEKKFMRAFKFAEEAHKGQLRKGGQPYITHPYETVKILKSLHVDEDTLIAALLHDVPEDTEKNIADVETRFGKRVAFLVEGITKLSKVHYQHDMAKRQIESLRKLFIHTAKDPRIIIIKLADRLHNMRTLQYIEKTEKRLRISRETLEIFVPIANLLGIEELKAELEDLCFRYLFPDDYSLLSDRMKTSREKNGKIIEETVMKVEEEFRLNNLQASVYGRRKNLYSIYKRILKEQNRLQDFDDFIALRIILNDKENCYRALWLIHSLFRPKPAKFKDYIAVPKRNGYQSLHTTVFGIGGLNTEFQIRTHEMHLEAEYGIAAHYFENTGSNIRNPHLEADKRSDWASKIVHYNDTTDYEDTGDDFMTNLKLDILHDRIFVFTPKGDSIDLPQGATCIDFAYEIHTEVGHRAIKAEINGKFEPMTTKLFNGDTVTIITSDIAKGPNRAWLGFIKTSAAKNKILDYFRKISKEEKLISGRILLQKELDRAGLGLIRDIPSKFIRSFGVRHGTGESLNEIMSKFGEGTVMPVDFVNEMQKVKENTTKSPINDSDRLTSTVLINSQPANQQGTLISVKLVSKDAVGQLSKILDVVADLNLSSLKTKAYLSLYRKLFVCKLTVMVNNYSQTSQLFENLEQVEGVLYVKRLFWQKKLNFVLMTLLTFAIWAGHPYLVHFIAKQWNYSAGNPIISNALLYAGILMLFIVVISLKRVTQRSFPELRETSALWFITFLLTGFAIVTLLAEMYFFSINYNWIVVMALIAGIISYLTVEYWSYRK